MPRYENLYHLVQAYDRLGHYLYSNEWTGDEIISYFPILVEEASQKKVNIEDHLQAVGERQRLIEKRIRHEAQKHIAEILKQARESLNQPRAELHEAYGICSR